MSTIDILFWLLIVMMGGVGWAIEVGLGQRYRAALSACVLAALGSGVFIMFWIEDKTSIEYEKIGPRVVKKSQPREGGNIEVIEEEGSGGKGKQGRDGAAVAKGGSKDGDIRVDMRQKVYSRAPFKDCPDCPDMVILPEGQFAFGSLPEEEGRSADEPARKQETIAKPFAIGRIEITRQEFQAFVKDSGYVSATQCDMGRRRGKFNWLNPGFEQDQRHAVTCLTMTDIEAYLKWLSDKTGREYRLPTDLEWEYAARANSDTAFATGDTLMRQHANFGRSRDGTVPAGTFPSNDFGLADMAGNLAEYTSVCKPRPADAAGPCERLIKGGAWNSPVASLRPAARAWAPDDVAVNFIGLRVVRAVDERDQDKILTADQRIALIREERIAAQMRAQAAEAAEKARRDAREAAVRASEVSDFVAKEREAMRRARAEARAKAELEAFEASKKGAKK